MAMARGIWIGLSASGLDGDKAGEWKYFWSNLPAHMPLEVMVEYTHLRHWIEQYHEEAKGELGWDQYQGWRWDGFHRHAVTVMLSYSFLVWLEWQQRQAQRRRGPPRGAFSPRPDRRRLSLPAVHRYIIEWLLFEAIADSMPQREQLVGLFQ
jgi:SRSO17 transposase